MLSARRAGCRDFGPLRDGGSTDLELTSRVTNGGRETSATRQFVRGNKAILDTPPVGTITHRSCDRYRLTPPDYHVYMCPQAHQRRRYPRYEALEEWPNRTKESRRCGRSQARVSNSTTIAAVF
jgi:hypothetical protein